MDSTSWMIVIFAIISILVVINYTVGFQSFLPVMIVDAQKALVLDNRLGADRVITEGINRYMPFGIEVVVGEVSLKEQPIDPPAQEIISKDNINLVVDMIATIKIVDPTKAVMDVEDYEASVKSLVMSSTLNKLGQMNFSDIQRKQDQVSKEIRDHMKEDCARWGLEVILVKFESITPPASIKEAMEKEIVAEKEKRAAILKAQGDHEVHDLHADGERILIEKRAEATHKVIKALKELMPDLSDETIMQFLTKTAYIDSMKELSSSSNSKFVLYPTDVQQPMEKVMNAEYMSRTTNQ
jgi:regulator of protease activity HflC (stomatin/prohibitin superfamily)